MMAANIEVNSYLPKSIFTLSLSSFTDSLFLAFVVYTMNFLLLFLESLSPVAFHWHCLPTCFSVSQLRRDTYSRDIALGQNPLYLWEFGMIVVIPGKGLSLKRACLNKKSLMMDGGRAALQDIMISSCWYFLNGIKVLSLEVALEECWWMYCRPRKHRGDVFAAYPGSTSRTDNLAALW